MSKNAEVNDKHSWVNRKSSIASFCSGNRLVAAALAEQHPFKDAFKKKGLPVLPSTKERVFQTECSKIEVFQAGDHPGLCDPIHFSYCCPMSLK